MRLALYSDLARQDIVKIREEISQLEITPTDDAMRSFRYSIIDSDEEHHIRISKSFDFYSLSTFRDLLFHVKEHRYTLLKIKECLQELDLKFCGFEIRDLDIINRFKLTYTHPDDFYDLTKWHAYEKENPRVFASMYQFWCQKTA